MQKTTNKQKRATFKEEILIHCKVSVMQFSRQTTELKGEMSHISLMKIGLNDAITLGSDQNK